MLLLRHVTLVAIWFVNFLTRSRCAASGLCVFAAELRQVVDHGSKDEDEAHVGAESLQPDVAAKAANLDGCLALRQSVSSNEQGPERGVGIPGQLNRPV